TCLEASSYSTSKDMELEVDEDFAQESQKKKREQEEAQKRETSRLPEIRLLWCSQRVPG
nr:hypothetical protein [Tanacetum cinerariifolium]